jgi:hypothetical protein
MQKIAYWRRPLRTSGTLSPNCAPAGSVGAPEAIALNALIAAYQPRHGDFADTAAIAQSVEGRHRRDRCRSILASAAEALDMVAVKLARILADDATCADHWRDLAGYAWLAAGNAERITGAK